MYYVEKWVQTQGRDRSIDVEELTYLDKKRIHHLKYYTWIEQQGKIVEELDAQWFDKNYWKNIHALTPKIDGLINKFNEKVGKNSNGIPIIRSTIKCNTKKPLNPLGILAINKETFSTI